MKWREEIWGFRVRLMNQPVQTATERKIGKEHVNPMWHDERSACGKPQIRGKDTTKSEEHPPSKIRTENCPHCEKVWTPWFKRLLEQQIGTIRGHFIFIPLHYAKLIEGRRKETIKQWNPNVKNYKTEVLSHLHRQTAWNNRLLLAESLTVQTYFWLQKEMNGTLFCHTGEHGPRSKTSSNKWNSWVLNKHSRWWLEMSSTMRRKKAKDHQERRINLSKRTILGKNPTSFSQSLNV